MVQSQVIKTFMLDWFNNSCIKWYSLRHEETKPLVKSYLKQWVSIPWGEISPCLFLTLPLSSKSLWTQRLGEAKTHLGFPHGLKPGNGQHRNTEGQQWHCGSGGVRYNHSAKHRVLWKHTPSPHPLTSHGLVILSYIVLCLPDTWTRINAASLHLHA